MANSRQVINSRLADTSSYRRSYPGAFTASDVYAVITLPGGEVRSLGSLIALSISTHRDTFPVGALSYVNPRGLTQGHVTIAGTLMFHTIDRSAMTLPNYRGHAHETITGNRIPGTAMPDELPLFDIHINYVNEIGMASFEAIFGVRLIDFGKTVSLENLHPVESYSYMALDYQPMQDVLSGRPGDTNFVLNPSDRPSVMLGDGSPGTYKSTFLQAGIEEDTGVQLKRGT